MSTITLNKLDALKYNLSKEDIEIVLGHKITLDSDGNSVLPIADVEKVERIAPIIAQLAALPPKAQRKMMHKLQREIGQKKAALAVAETEAAEAGTLKDRYYAAYGELCVWANQPLVLEKPGSTCMHKLRAAGTAGELLVASVTMGHDTIKDWDEIWEQASVFIVEHDWAKAFANAKDYGGNEFKLPDDVCAFEFKISGRRCIMVTTELNGQLCMAPHIETSAGWIVPLVQYVCGTDGRWVTLQDIKDQSDFAVHAGLVQLLGDQIRAVAIALDAEVAVSDVVRADHKLNHARERRGKLPINSYHVVSLARRARVAAPLPAGADGLGDTGIHKRLHFVRGHWRHFDTWKTWIKWHLRGDPDLGFIDKHYKL